MGQEGAPLRGQSCRQERAIDLLVQCLERLSRYGAGEQYSLSALVKEADAVQAKLNL